MWVIRGVVGDAAGGHVCTNYTISPDALRAESDYFDRVGRDGFAPLPVTENGDSLVSLSFDDEWQLRAFMTVVLPVADRSGFSPSTADHQETVSLMNGVVVVLERFLFRDEFLHHVVEKLWAKLGLFRFWTAGAIVPPGHSRFANLTASRLKCAQEQSTTAHETMLMTVPPPDFVAMMQCLASDQSECPVGWAIVLAAKYLERRNLMAYPPRPGLVEEVLKAIRLRGAPHHLLDALPSMYCFKDALNESPDLKNEFDAFRRLHRVVPPSAREPATMRLFDDFGDAWRTPAAPSDLLLDIKCMVDRGRLNVVDDYHLCARFSFFNTCPDPVCSLDRSPQDQLIAHVLDELVANKKCAVSIPRSPQAAFMMFKVECLPLLQSLVAAPMSLPAVLNVSVDRRDLPMLFAPDAKRPYACAGRERAACHFIARCDVEALPQRDGGEDAQKRRRAEDIEPI